MGVWSSLKKGLDTIFYIRPKKWISWDFLSSNTQQNIDLVKDAFKVSQPTRKESFKQAMHRHGVSEHELKRLQTRYVLFSYFFLTLGLGVVFYATQALSNSYFSQFSASICLSFFIFSMAFRYNFWAYQIRVKKLGCTFKQWWNDLCGSKDPS